MVRVFLLGLISAAVLGGALIAPAPALGVAGFGDVDEGRYFTQAVQWMVDEGITNGVSESCFAPDGAVTRGQAAAFLWRTEGEPTARSHNFIDVGAAYQQRPVSWLAARGYAVGATATEYFPDDPITRGDFASMLHRIAGRPSAPMHSFVDVTKPSQHQPVSWMVSESITTGTSESTFSPDAEVSRGQVAAFLYRYQGEPPVVVSSHSPRCEPRSDELTLRRVGEIRGDISPKSVVFSGVDRFFVQNMMYRHTVTVYDRSLSLVGTISDQVVLSDFGVSGASPGASYRGSPVEAAFTSDGRYAYVSNYKMYGPGYSRPGHDECTPGNWDDSFLYRVDVESLAVEQVIGVGPVPKFVAVTPDDTKVLTTNWCGFDMSVVDTATATEVARIPIGSYPRGIAVSSDSTKAYVAVMGASEVAVVDLTDLTAPLSWITVGRAPRSLVISEDDRYLYVSLNHVSRVVKVDLSTNTVVGTATTGRGPRSMAISDDGSAVFVVNYHKHTFSKVRTSDMVVLQTLATPAWPIGITYDPVDNRVWVSTYPGTIQIYEDTPQ